MPATDDACGHPQPGGESVRRDRRETTAITVLALVLTALVLVIGAARALGGRPSA